MSKETMSQGFSYISLLHDWQSFYECVNVQVQSLHRGGEAGNFPGCLLASLQPSAATLSFCYSPKSVLQAFILHYSNQ